jgi:2-polyprenyl-3-methyl-5-hydroxy-6-metoxy-1,4-benzoquinol methylase
MFARIRGKLAERTFTREELLTSYQELLRRKPADEVDLQTHLAAHLTDADFRASIMKSPEYIALQTPYPGRKIQLSELDAEMNRIDEMAQSDTFNDLRETNSFWVDLPAINADPSSHVYMDWVMETYRSIANQDYATKNEASTFLNHDLASVPFPYATRDPYVVGEQLMAIGHVIQSMKLAPGSRILEMGFGWGNTSLQLARMGYDVSGIDIEKKFVDMVNLQAKMLNVPIRPRQGTFFDIETLDEKFDAVLFFESFHHCADHIRLLKSIPAVLKVGGKLVLAGEAINNALPYPWGINPGGQAVYCIRKYGWLELCFRENYLLGLLDGLGWDVVKHNFPQSATGITYIATLRGS